MFLENAHVAERRATGSEGQPVPAHRPVFGRAGRRGFPVAAAIFVVVLAEKGGVRFPAINRPCGLPDGLRVGPDDGLAAKAFQLFQVAAVEQGIVVPVVGDEEFGLGFHVKSLCRQAS